VPFQVVAQLLLQDQREEKAHPRLISTSRRELTTQTHQLRVERVHALGLRIVYRLQLLELCHRRHRRRQAE
jgi:hypothetical protein